MSSDGIVAPPGNTSGQVPEAKPSRGERLHRVRYRLLFGGITLAAGGVIFSLNMLGSCLELTEDPFSGDLVATSCDSGVLAAIPEWIAVPLLMLAHIAVLSGMVMAVLGLGAIVAGGTRRLAGTRNGHETEPSPMQAARGKPPTDA